MGRDKKGHRNREKEMKEGKLRERERDGEREKGG